MNRKIVLPVPVKKLVLPKLNYFQKTMSYFYTHSIYFLFEIKKLKTLIFLVLILLRNC